jgi:3-hydroxyacyl-[acyl-carrier-protein] dehydratase
MTTASGSGAELDALDVNGIMELLPHRPPFLMIDKIVDIKKGESATGIKTVSINEPFFLGHFPGFPIMPGVLIVEAMAQTAGTVVVHSLGHEGRGKLVFFMTVDKGRFRHPVMPGDLLELKVKIVRRRGPVWKFEGSAYVAGKLCAEAEFSAMIMEKDGKPAAVDE